MPREAFIKQRIFSKLFLYGSLALLVGPFVFLILYSFLTSSMDDQESWQFIIKETLPGLIGNTGILIAFTLIFSLIFGISQAVLIELTSLKRKKLFHILFILPLVFPLYIISYIYVGAFEYSGAMPTLIRGAWGLDITQVLNIKSSLAIALIFSFVLSPYVYLFMKSFLMRIDHKLIWTSRSMGKKPNEILKTLIIPQSKPWIFSAGIFVTLEVLCDFGGVSIFNYETFSTAIYESWVSLYSFKTAVKISILPLVLATVLFISNYQMKKKMINRESLGDITLFQLNSKKSFLINVILMIYILFSLAFPVAQLIIWSWEEFTLEKVLGTWSYLQDTLTIGIVAAIFIALITLCSNFLARFSFNKKENFFSNFLKLGYALPGTIVGIGLMAFTSILGINFFGPIAFIALIIGLLMRFYSVSFDMQHKSYELITKKVDWASSSLGKNNLQSFFKVHLPLMKPALFSSMLLCFLEVVKEMPVTLILRPHGFDTLATKIYELTSEGEWERSSLFALILIIFGSVPVMLDSVKD